MNLPRELETINSEFDGRYKTNFNKVIKDLDNKYSWFHLEKETIMSSMGNYYYLLSEEDQEYYVKTGKKTFNEFFFKKFLLK
jgi:hypothetical protein